MQATVSGEPDDGYLIASSQGNITCVVYDRAAPHAYRGTFRVVAHGDIDGTEGTDGLDATSTPLGPAFPSGKLVVMDGANTTPTAAPPTRTSRWSPGRTSPMPCGSTDDRRWSGEPIR